MKKYFYSMLVLAMSAFAFTACDDVPAPYGLPGSGDDSGNGSTPLPEGVYADESFSEDFGTFEEKTITGTPWVLDSYGYAKATGYEGGSTTASKSYLISKSIDLSNSTEAYVTFQYVLRYATDNNGTPKEGVENKVLVTGNYTGDPTTTAWTDITGTLIEVRDWNSWQTFNAAIPAELIGKDKVVVALYYACETNSATWEVKELKIAEGKAEETPETPDTPVTPEGDELLPNGNFEGWSNGLPTNWKSASTASSATLEQSTDAHGGSYSVLVKGASSNKRIAYKETGLKAGDYTITFYAKAVGDAASVRPGYVAVVDGKVSGNYNYGDYTNDIPNTGWTEVTHSFTLASDATVCVLVMNPKNNGDVLIDDFTLTTTNGGLLEGGSEEETPDEPVGNPYTKVSTMAAGTYVIAAQKEGSSYVVASNIAADKTYGYLQITDATLNGSTVTATEANEFIFKAVDGGYTIQDASGRYYIMTGTYNSFNLTDAPDSGHIWTVSFNDDGTVVITNVEMNKTMQYDTSYNSYGVYPDVRGTYPCLFKK